MTSIFNYHDAIEQLNVPLDTKQMLQKTVKVDAVSPLDSLHEKKRICLVSRMLSDQEPVIRRTSGSISWWQNISRYFRWKTSTIVTKEKADLSVKDIIFILDLVDRLFSTLILLYRQWSLVDDDSSFIVFVRFCSSSCEIFCFRINQSEFISPSIRLHLFIWKWIRYEIKWSLFQSKKSRSSMRG
jgi:hypothetical protein